MTTMTRQPNGSLKTAGIIIGIVLTLGGIIWAFATQSGNLDGAIEDIDKHEKQYEKVEGRVNTVEKAVIKIETTMGHFQKGQEDMMSIQKEILGELRKE